MPRTRSKTSSTSKTHVVVIDLVLDLVLKVLEDLDVEGIVVDIEDLEDLVLDNIKDVGLDIEDLFDIEDGVLDIDDLEDEVEDRWPRPRYRGSRPRARPRGPRHR